MWAEPRRERYSKLPPKGYNRPSRRGRPRKEARQENKIKTPFSHLVNSANTKETSSFHKSRRLELSRKKKNGSFVSCVPEKLQQLLLKQSRPQQELENVISPPVKAEGIRDSKSLPHEKETTEQDLEEDLEEEGTLIVDDEVASLHGAVVDEVIKDYPQENAGRNQPQDDSCCKPNFATLDSHTNSSSRSIQDSIEDDRIEHNIGQRTSEGVEYGGSDGVERAYKNHVSTLAEHHEITATDSSERNVLHERRTSSCPSSPQEDVLRIDDGAEDEEAKDAPRTEEDEEDDDDNHVSLSEALAKLVDSDESAHGAEQETLTIHPFTSEENGPPYALLNPPHSGVEIIEVEQLTRSRVPSAAVAVDLCHGALAAPTADSSCRTKEPSNASCLPFSTVAGNL